MIISLFRVLSFWLGWIANYSRYRGERICPSCGVAMSVTAQRYGFEYQDEVAGPGRIVRTSSDHLVVELKCPNCKCGEKAC